MSLKTVLFSPEDGRLRSGWRILYFFVLYFSILFLAALLAMRLLAYEPNQFDPQNLLIGGLVNTLGASLAVYGVRRSMDRKSVESLGLHPEGMWRDLGAGVGIAGLMMLIVFILMMATGWMTLDHFIWEQAAVSESAMSIFKLVLLFLLTGISEELLFRGYVFQNLAEGTNVGIAVLLSSLIFSLFHIANPNALDLAPVVGLFAAGIFFAYTYLRSGSLWLAIGAHIGWNIFENTVFGMSVSGLNASGLVSTTVTGPELFTGGTFGPEAGLVMLPAFILGTILIYLYTKK